MRSRSGSGKHFPLELGAIVRRRVNRIAEILALPVLLLLLSRAALALRFARCDGEDEKESDKRDRFFMKVAR